MQFEKVYILGKGSVAVRCKKIACDFFEKEVEDLSSLQNDELDRYLNNIRNSLVISANNFHIIKEPCLSNNVVINYHNALLPNHKGVHAHVWAIYDGDKKSGITWHKVTKSIDAGDIIVQREIELDQQITGIKLLLKQQNMAVDSFQECLEALVEDRPMKPQQGSGKIHLRKDIPENGEIDPAMPFERLSCFLRATDCDVPEMRPYINIAGKKYSSVQYSIDEDRIELFIGNGKMKLTVNR